VTADFEMDENVFDIDPAEGLAVSSWDPVRPRTRNACWSERALGLARPWLELTGVQAHVNLDEEVLP
jgi:hypothetical protein